jgi:hypothetical protein
MPGAPSIFSRTRGDTSQRAVPVFAAYVMSLEIARLDLKHSLIQPCRIHHTNSDVPEAWRVPLSAFAEVEDGPKHDHYVCQKLHSERDGRKDELYVGVRQACVPGPQLRTQTHRFGVEDDKRWQAEARTSGWLCGRDQSGRTHV